MDCIFRKRRDALAAQSNGTAAVATDDRESVQVAAEVVERIAGEGPAEARRANLAAVLQEIAAEMEKAWPDDREGGEG